MTSINSAEADITSEPRCLLLTIKSSCWAGLLGSHKEFTLILQYICHLNSWTKFSSTFSLVLFAVFDRLLPNVDFRQSNKGSRCVRCMGVSSHSSNTLGCQWTVHLSYQRRREEMLVGVMIVTERVGTSERHFCFLTEGSLKLYLLTLLQTGLCNENWNRVSSLLRIWCNSPGPLIGPWADINLDFLEDSVYSGLHLTERMVDKIWRKSWHFIENRRSLRKRQTSSVVECKSEWVIACFLFLSQYL